MANVEGTIRVRDQFSANINKLASKMSNATHRVSDFKSQLSGGFSPRVNSGPIDKLNNKLSSTKGLFTKLVGANLVGTGISRGIGFIGNSVKSLSEELNDSSKAWQTFQGNMQMNGKTPQQIKTVKGTLQKFAQDTIYSASDMATAYSQFDSVGVKNADKIVTGMGGIAASAENPKQAMKTLSQQAVQAASRPMMQWQDYKLMLDQAPAGMAKVAKTMGMSLQDLNQQIQAGTVKSSDFLNALSKTGNSKGFANLARKYKTVGEAMDGFKETIANKLQEPFESTSKIGIKAITNITDKLDKIDFKKITKKMIPFIQNVMKQAGRLARFLGGVFGNIWKGLSESSAASSIIKMFNSIGEAIASISKRTNGKNPFSIFQTLSKGIGNVIGTIADSIGKLVTSLGKMDPNTLKMIGIALFILKKGMKGVYFGALIYGLKFLSKLNPGQLDLFAKSLISIAAGIVAMKLAMKGYQVVTKGIGAFKALKGTLGRKPKRRKKPKTPKSPKNRNKPENGASKKWLQLGAALLMAGTGAALAGLGFYLLTNSIIKLSKSGGLAIGLMIGFVAVIVAIGVAVTLAGSAMLAGAIGFLIFGAALFLIGAAIFIAAAGLSILATQLPIIQKYGLGASLAIVALGLAIAAFGIGAIIGAIGAIALGVGLVVLGAGMAVAAIGAGLLGIAILIIGAGVFIASIGIMIMAAFLPIVAKTALSAGLGLMVLSAGMLLVGLAAVALSIGLILLFPALTLLGVGLIIAGAGAVIFAVGAFLVGAALMVVGLGLLVIAAGINAIVKAVGNMVSSMANAMNGVINAVKNGFNTVKTWISNGVKGAVDTVTNFVGSMKNAGANLMHGLANGISGAVGAVTNKIKGVASGVVGGFKKLLGIHSPSRVFKGFGRYMDMGLAIGIDKHAKLPNQSIDNLASDMNSFEPNIQSPKENIDTPTSNPFTSNDSHNKYSDFNTEKENYSQSQNSSIDRSVHISNGAIQIISSGNEAIDGNKILSEIEKILKSKKEGGIGYGYE